MSLFPFVFQIRIDLFFSFSYICTRAISLVLEVGWERTFLYIRNVRMNYREEIIGVYMLKKNNLLSVFGIHKNIEWTGGDGVLFQFKEIMYRIPSK